MLPVGQQQVVFASDRCGRGTTTMPINPESSRRDNDRRSSVPRRPVRGVGFQPHRVVDGTAQLLFAPEVALRRLNRDIPEETLDLIQFAAGLATESRTRATKIVRRELLDAVLFLAAGALHQLRLE